MTCTVVRTVVDLHLDDPARQASAVVATTQHGAEQLAGDVVSLAPEERSR